MVCFIYLQYESYEKEGVLSLAHFLQLDTKTIKKLYKVINPKGTTRKKVVPFVVLIIKNGLNPAQISNLHLINQFP